MERKKERERGRGGRENRLCFSRDSLKTFEISFSFKAKRTYIKFSNQLTSVI